MKLKYKTGKRKCQKNYYYLTVNTYSYEHGNSKVRTENFYNVNSIKALRRKAAKDSKLFHNSNIYEMKYMLMMDPKDDFKAGNVVLEIRKPVY